MRVVFGSLRFRRSGRCDGQYATGCRHGVKRPPPPLDLTDPRLILKRMLNQSPSLDLMFQALADPARRSMVSRLTRGPASVSALAEPLDMSLPAVMQHLQVLETSGLVRTEKVGRVRTCTIEPKALRTAEEWIIGQRAIWERRLDRLGDYLAEHAAESRRRKS